MKNSNEYADSDSSPTLYNNINTSTLFEARDSNTRPDVDVDGPLFSALEKRSRHISGSKSEDHFIKTLSGRHIYTKGRPPWYDKEGRHSKPYIIGICGGSASGKTTVANRIIELLEIPWMTVLSMDSFYNVLTPEQHALAGNGQYNFDSPRAVDFELLYETLKRLHSGKSVEVPVYDFATHRRNKQSKLMYGADVIIFEGIFAFYDQRIVDLMDMKVYVDTDLDLRLVRRLLRDCHERGRSTEDILGQYLKYVKPAYDQYIAPGMHAADLLVPRGGENIVAIELIVKMIKKELVCRGYAINNSARRMNTFTAVPSSTPCQLPTCLKLVQQTVQVRGLHTLIRNVETPRDEFIFYSERLMRVLIENALNFLQFKDVKIITVAGIEMKGKRLADKICGVAIMRAGETMENAVRSVVKDCKMGKILIQTNEDTMEPELYYLRLPERVQEYKILLMDASVATGAAAIMAIRVLIDHDVPEENIFLVSLLMAKTGVHNIAYAFPKVTLLTTAVDHDLDELGRVVPGLGSFGDRYYGTDRYTVHTSSRVTVENKEVQNGDIDHDIENTLMKIDE